MELENIVNVELEFLRKYFNCKSKKVPISDELDAMGMQLEYKYKEKLNEVSEAIKWYYVENIVNGRSSEEIQRNYGYTNSFIQSLEELLIKCLAA